MAEPLEVPEYPRLVADVVYLGQLALAFGLTHRITLHPTLEPETDTTHTVMLTWVACSLAARHHMLNIGLVAQFAAVHDIPEVFAGDTPTLRISVNERTAKDRREEVAASKIQDRFGTSLTPWVAEMLEVYRQQRLPEARFVRAVDKMLPKITHLLNDCLVLHSMGMGASEFRARMDQQAAELETFAGEFGEALELREFLVCEIERRLAREGAGSSAK